MHLQTKFDQSLIFIIFYFICRSCYTSSQSLVHYVVLRTKNSTLLHLVLFNRQDVTHCNNRS